MLHCPNCGKELPEGSNYCMSCGARLPEEKAEASGPSETYGFETPPFSDVRAVIVERFEGLRMRDAEAISSCMDSEMYTKFDDWPPFRRQRNEGLRNEADAVKVLSSYTYSIDDLAIDIYDSVGVATFHLSYSGQVRKSPFQIRSRVTVVLRKVGDAWKIVHEHYSRFPTAVPQPSPGRPSWRRPWPAQG